MLLDSHGTAQELLSVRYRQTSNGRGGLRRATPSLLLGKEMPLFAGRRSSNVPVARSAVPPDGRRPWVHFLAYGGTPPSGKYILHVRDHRGTVRSRSQ